MVFLLSLCTKHTWCILTAGFYYTGRMCGLAYLERALNAFNIMGMCD